MFPLKGDFEISLKSIVLVYSFYFIFFRAHNFFFRLELYLFFIYISPDGISCCLIFCLTKSNITKVELACLVMIIK